MWIFGFGSLMFDGWEKDHDCLRRSWADLTGYRRTFNKMSIESRGTKETPGLTLNLEAADGTPCRGVAFEFRDDEKSEAMKKVLHKREACGPTTVGILLEDGTRVDALAYIYAGKYLLAAGTTLAQKADMVRAAKGGTRSTGLEYVQAIYEGLDGIGVRDPAVTELWDAVKAKPAEG